MKFIVTQCSVLPDTAAPECKSLSQIDSINAQIRLETVKQARTPGIGITPEALALRVNTVITDLQQAKVFDEESNLVIKKAIWVTQNAVDWHCLGDPSVGVEVPIDPYLPLDKEEVVQSVSTLFWAYDQYLTYIHWMYGEFLDSIHVDTKHIYGVLFEVEKLAGIPIILPGVWKRPFRAFFTKRVAEQPPLLQLETPSHESEDPASE